MRNNGIKIAVSAVTTVLLIAVIAIAGAAFSNSSNVGAQTSPTTGTQATSTPTAKQTEAKKYSDLYLQDLAKNLGVTVDKLTGSLTQASKDVIAQMVTDGKLTQAQADAINKSIDDRAAKGEYGFGMMGGRGGMMGGHDGMMGGKEGMMGDRALMDSIMQAATKAVADKLGMTTDQLKTALQGGQTLSAIAASKNVSVDDLKAAVIAAVKPLLDQAVKDGKLTQAQADTMLQHFQNMDFSKGFGFGMMGGPGFGPGGRGMGHHGFGGNTNQNTQPSTGSGDSY